MPSLTPAMQKFVLHWGEMGDRWGVNRSVAQIHALLFVTGKPLDAEEVSDTLSMARSNVSTSLKELMAWGLIRMVHVVGDRRDHYESLADVWEMLERVLDERRKREIEPTIRLLEECIQEAEKHSKEPPEVAKRLRAVHDLMTLADGWYVQMRKLPREPLVRFFKAGGKVRDWLGLKG